MGKDHIDNGRAKATVLISYNHNDSEIAEKVSEALTNEGFPVILDRSSMMAGDDIKSFIKESVKKSDATISIVSRKSLLSAWVAMESSLSFYREVFDDNKRFIPCHIDFDFFDRGFVDEALDHIEEELKDIRERINKRNERGRQTRDLDVEKDRYNELQNNIDKIVRQLRDSLSIDISGKNFDKGLVKVINTLNTIKTNNQKSRNNTLSGLIKNISAETTDYANRAQLAFTVELVNRTSKNLINPVVELIVRNRKTFSQKIISEKIIIEYTEAYHNADKLHGS